MKNEIDPKIATGVIVALVMLVAVVLYLNLRSPSGELTPEQAGAGKPMRPGELPPGVPPPPWAQDSSAPGQATPQSNQ